jgi:hypothetical protein
LDGNSSPAGNKTVTFLQAMWNVSRIFAE